MEVGLTMTQCADDNYPMELLRGIWYSCGGADGATKHMFCDSWDGASRSFILEGIQQNASGINKLDNEWIVTCR